MRTSNNYAVELLKKINKITIHRVPIYGFFVYEGYSLWPFFQHHIWIDIQNFTENKQFFIPSFTRQRRVAGAIKDFILYVFISISSLIFYVKSIVRKPRVIIYSIDIAKGNIAGDPRIGKVFQFLYGNRIRFGEILHTVFGKGILSNFFKRRRFTFYLESINILYAFKKHFGMNYFSGFVSENIDLSPFSDEEKPFVRWLMKRYADRAEQSVYKIQVFRRFFGHIKPQYFFTIDDFRYYNEILLAAKLSGVSSYAFQHGRFNVNLVALVNYGIPSERCLVPDNFFVWNEYWRKELCKISQAFQHHNAHVTVGGRPSLSTWPPNLNPINDGTFTVLIPYEVRASSEEIMQYIEQILHCPNTKVIFKLRGDMSVDVQKEKVEQFLTEGRLTLKSELTFQEWNRIDLVIGSYSTFLYEAVEMGLPVGILPIKTMEAHDLVENGLAGLLDVDENDFCNKLMTLTSLPPEELERRMSVIKTSVSIEDKLRELFTIRQPNSNF